MNQINEDSNEDFLDIYTQDCNTNQEYEVN